MWVAGAGECKKRADLNNPLLVLADVNLVCCTAAQRSPPCPSVMWLEGTVGTGPCRAGPAVLQPGRLLPGCSHTAAASPYPCSWLAQGLQSSLPNSSWIAKDFSSVLKLARYLCTNNDFLTPVNN